MLQRRNNRVLKVKMGYNYSTYFSNISMKKESLALNALFPLFIMSENIRRIAHLHKLLGMTMCVKFFTIQ